MAGGWLRVAGDEQRATRNGFYRRGAETRRSWPRRSGALQKIGLGLGLSGERVTGGGWMVILDLGFGNADCGLRQCEKRKAEMKLEVLVNKLGRPLSMKVAATSVRSGLPVAMLFPTGDQRREKRWVER